MRVVAGALQLQPRRLRVDLRHRLQGVRRVAGEQAEHQRPGELAAAQGEGGVEGLGGGGRGDQRRGADTADLRRRSLLKKLLFLFASAPGKVFSKEAIVQAVWNVEYHPLRHDAALFTNIMRIRRLLGEDGSEIIRVTEDGYRFVPPRDFIFVIPR